MYMKKLLISLAIAFTLITPTQKAQAIEPKTKAFLVMCAYGTVGGALLGFASMAFGTNSRAIAQGASLGLYAGIIFGGYVISSHRDPNAPVDEYEQDPYGAPPMDQGYPPPGGGGGFGAPAPEDDGGGSGFFGSPNRVIEINDKFVRNFRPLNEKRGHLNAPPVYVNLYHSTF